jgi:hypothetical protein
MRNLREPILNFAALLHGNALFETLVSSLGGGRPTERGLLADAFRHAGVSLKAVTRDDVVRLLPVIQGRLATCCSEALAAERVRGLFSYLDRCETKLAS